jgi:hypothetical protein
MDHATAFEGPVWAPEAKITGNLSVEGDLIIAGTIPTTSPAFTDLVAASKHQVQAELNEQLFQGYSTIIFNDIRNKGVDLDKITQGGREVIKGNQLGYHITDSNLQRVGMLKDLQTQGEALLSQTLYVTDSRVGVNTMDPSAALAIWDEECEFTVGKRKQDTVYIGTPRRQRLVIGANAKDTMTFDVDGSVHVDQLRLGKSILTSSATVPNVEGPLGQIAFNETPQQGSALGWICLGGTRWASFGKVD